MPELPEVEVTRRTIAPPLAGAEVHSVRLGAPLRWPLGVQPDALVGGRVGAVSRRGKYLWVPVSGADHPDAGLLLHLGMSGSLAMGLEAAPPGKHDHFDMVTSHGTLRLTDPRRFGAVVWSPSMSSGMAARLLAGLGLEPFDPALDAATLHAGLQRRRCSVKAALLAGDVVVGAGNIYACEALFHAGIDPRMRCHNLSRPRCEKLLVALRQVLGRAMQLGGSTLRDFRDAHGMSGAFQDEAVVYGREGEGCVRCGGRLRRIVQQQRSTFFCPSCQRR